MSEKLSALVRAGEDQRRPRTGRGLVLNSPQEEPTEGEGDGKEDGGEEEEEEEIEVLKEEGE